MPSICAIVNCCDKYGHSQNISFHKFPFKRKEQFEKWLNFVQREPEWRPSKWSSICSRHFCAEDFNHVNNRKTLKKSAIPSINASTTNRPTALTRPSINASTTNRPTALTRPSINAALTNRPTALTRPVECLTKETHSTPTTESDADLDECLENDAGLSEDESEIAEANTLCRLCANTTKCSVNFSQNLEIFAMIQKCFSTFNIRTDDNLPKDICHECQKHLEASVSFIDRVSLAQSKLQLMFQRAEKGVVTKSERVLNIKQEPIVNVKQEKQESQYDKDNFEELLIDGEVYHDDNEGESKAFEQKFNFFDFPMTNTHDIINNCDIMEIINLDDAFIDIPDDDALDEQNLPNINIDNVIESQIKNLLKGMTNEEHSYASSLGNSICKQETNFETESIQQNNNVTVENVNVSLTEEEHYSECMTVADVQEIQTETAENNYESKTRRHHNKPNIVVLNESIVKSADAFQPHKCLYCLSTFFSIETLQQHERLVHAITPQILPMVSVPAAHVQEQNINDEGQFGWPIYESRVNYDISENLKIEDDSQESVSNVRTLNRCVRFGEDTASASPTILNIETLRTQSQPPQQQQAPVKPDDIMPNEQIFFQPQQEQVQEQQEYQQTSLYPHEHQQLPEHNVQNYVGKSDFYAPHQEQQEQFYKQPFYYVDNFEQRPHHEEEVPYQEEQHSPSFANYHDNSSNHVQFYEPTDFDTNNDNHHNMQHNLYTNNNNKSINNSNNCNINNNSNVSEERAMLNRYARILRKNHAKMRLLDRLSHHCKYLSRKYVKLHGKCKNLEQNLCHLQAQQDKEPAKPACAQIKYKCHMCSASFASIWQLMQHKQLEKHHVRPPRKYYGARCNNCQRNFIKPLALQNHKRYLCPAVDRRSGLNHLSIVKQT